MPSIKDLIELMGTSWPISLGLLLASASMLLADHLGLPYLASLPAWAPGAAFTVAVFSGATLTVSIIKSTISLICRPFDRRRRRKRQANHVAALADLSNDEGYILAWAVANRTQVISAPYFNATVKALITKGYLLMPPGSHSPVETPFLIPDHIWEAIKADLRDANLGDLVGARPFDRW